ncbi:osiris 10a [Cochliomyia hominivorax]
MDNILAITTESGDSVHEFKYCLKKSSHPNLRECVGRTAISFLQRFDEKDNYTLTESVIASRDDKLASRSLVNFLDTDPVDFRGILENAGAVLSQRSLEFHMDTIYPGLMLKIGPSADSSSVAQFVLDPAVDERNFNYEEPSTARILTKQYILPFLLGLKFNLVALVPILFTVICLLLKKSLFIAKLVIYISSILGVGGIASALGSTAGWGSFFGGAIPPPPLHHSHSHGFGGGHFVSNIGLYPGKNTVYSQYDQDELQHNSPYKRQDRKVVFEKTRENAGRSTAAPIIATPVSDHFYDYEKQVLMQDRSGKGRHTNGKLGPSAYAEDDEEVAGVIKVSSSHRFKTQDDSGWKVINLRV